MKYSHIALYPALIST